MRENMIPAMLCMAVTLGFGTAITKSGINSKWQWGRLGLDPEINISALLDDVMGFVFSCAIGFAIFMAIKQFILPTANRTWSFLLHRSVSKYQILCSKITACLLLVMITLGLPWSYLCWLGLSAKLPTTGYTYIHGCCFIGIAFLLYLAMAIIAVSQARWVGTRLFPIIVLSLVSLLFAGVTTTIVVTSLILSTIILVIDLFTQFSFREFK